MAVQAPKTGGNSNFKPQDPLDPGAYPARLVQVIDLGLQKQRPYAGEEKPPKHELYTTYEMADEFMKDEDGKDIEDKPRWLSETFPVNPLDSDLAKSTERYIAHDPELAHEGNWAALLGNPCTITIVQKKGKGQNADKIYNNIGGVSAMRPKEAAKLPDLVNPPKLFDLDDPDLEIFLSLPTWLQDKIKENLNFGGSPLEVLLEGHEGGDKGSTPKDEEKGAQQDAAGSSDDDGDDW